ncbi:MAG TPA: thermonuclease family protein [Candidatus Limnocylindria bacterium]|nr:thermonuclease family protein [Candidatus Limnocylindria bacterium]
MTDGDTIRVRLNGLDVAVRYIGIDTPETVDPRRDVQCFGREAATANAALVADKTVDLEKDVSETDRFGRLLRYVYVGDAMVNAELVRRGFAKATTYPPDVKYQERFVALEAEARRAEAGLWGSACAARPPATTAPTTAAPPATTPRATLPPAVTRTPAPPTAPPTPVPTVARTTAPLPTLARTATPAPAPTSRSNCDPSYPTVCIPPAPPDLDCPQVPYRNFRVLPPDPHRFDRDRDGIGCET